VCSLASPAAAGFNPVIANQPGQGQQQQLAAVQAQLAALQAVPGQLAQVLATQAQVLANQGQMLASLADLQAGQAQLRAQQGNDRLRLHNTRMQNAVGPPPLLAPLAKEQLPPAGAAAPGTLPPPNIFPATWTAVQQVGAMQRGASMCATERRKLACACLYLLMLCLIYFPTYQPCPSPSFCCS
jgi:hypothetical protein